MDWFEDGDCVVSQVEGDNELSVHILRDSSVESCSESQHLFIIVNVLEEISLWLIWKKLVNITEGVNFITKSIVRWDLKSLRFSGLGVFNVSNLEMLSELCLEVILCEFIYSIYPKYSTEGFNGSSWYYLITSQVIIPDEVLSWLVHSE